MPFSSDLDGVYRSIIKPAVESVNLVCRRADEIRGNGIIIQEIWRSHCEARLVIADLTTWNPNVFYELGIADTIGKGTILIAQRDTSNRKFPFDVTHRRRITYEPTLEGGQELRERLVEHIGAVMQPSIVGR